jgi:DNA repair protein RadC
MLNSLTPLHYSIQGLPESERPRERLLRHGPESMATAELIAIILGSGMKNIPVLQLAQEIVMRFGNMQNLAEASIEELCQIKGLGPAKALQLKAAFSLGLRLSKQAPSAKYRIENPVHAYNLVKDELEREPRELFVVILQDIKGCSLGHHIVAIGTLSNTLVHPREVFYPAIRHHAASMILVHNHPSGDPTPSQQDLDITQNLIEAGDLMGIPVNDHLIIGNKCYVSMRQRGIAFKV